MKSHLEESLALALTREGLSHFQREYRFASPRRWRFDFAFPENKIALECEGGIWSRGRHARPAGIVKDIEKYNTATLLGWKVIRVTKEMIDDGSAIYCAKELLCL